MCDILVFKQQYSSYFVDTISYRSIYPCVDRNRPVSPYLAHRVDLEVFSDVIS